MYNEERQPIINKSSILIIVLSILLIVFVVMFLFNRREWVIESISPGDIAGSIVILQDGSLWTWAASQELGMVQEPFHLMDNVVQAESGDGIIVLTMDGVLWRITNFLDLIADKQLEPEIEKIMENVKYFRAVMSAISIICNDNNLWLMHTEWRRAVSIYYAEDEELQRASELIPQLTDPYYINPILVLSNVRYVDREGEMAITYDDVLWGWGRNELGGVGDGTTLDRMIPVQILDDVQHVDGLFHRMALRNDGTLWAWGENYFGQIGNGLRENQLTPVQVLDDVRAFSAGHGVSMAIRNDNTLWAWGANYWGHVGDGTRTTRTQPVKIMDDVLYARAGGYIFFQFDDWATGIHIPSFAIRTNGSLWAWGDNRLAQLGIGRRGTGVTIPVRIMNNVVYVSSSAHLNAAVQRNGTLWIWGGMTALVIQFELSRSSAWGFYPERIINNVRLSR